MKTIFQLQKIIFIGLFFLIIGNVWGQTSSNASCPWISQNVCSNVWTLCGHASVEMVLAKYENRAPVANNVLAYNIKIRNYRGQTPASSCALSGTPNPNDLMWLMDQYGFKSKWYGSTASSYSNSSGTLTLQALANLLKGISKNWIFQV